MRPPRHLVESAPIKTGLQAKGACSPWHISAVHFPGFFSIGRFSSPPQSSVLPSSQIERRVEGLQYQFTTTVPGNMYSMSMSRAGIRSFFPSEQLGACDAVAQATVSHCRGACDAGEEL